MQSLIELRNVEKEYGQGEARLRILKGINLKVKKSEISAIMGPSGSGKSTMLSILGCLDRPTKGNLIIDGVDVSKIDNNSLARIRREKIGFIFQSFNLIPTFTAIENVELPMIFSKRMGRSARLSRARELLGMVGLGHRMDHHSSQLSGGEVQRVAIARALANDPPIILADEPTGNLDSKSGKEIMDILIRLNKERGVTLLIVTHDNSIAKYAERTIRIKDGIIVGGN
jgi:putative ABC transport system ATP-binding protein